jgi:hypothetical protein
MISQGIKKKIIWSQNEVSKKKIDTWVNHIVSSLSREDKIYIQDESEFCQSETYLPYIIKVWFEWDFDRSMQYVRSCLKFTKNPNLCQTEI